MKNAGVKMQMMKAMGKGIESAEYSRKKVRGLIGKKAAGKMKPEPLPAKLQSMVNKRKMIVNKRYLAK